MQKANFLITLLFILLPFTKTGAQVPFQLKGWITTNDNKPVANATIRLSHTRSTVFTNSEGRFVISVAQLPDTLTVTHINYIKVVFPLSKKGDSIHFRLKPDTLHLETVEVNTGFQKLPKERATGSFALVNQSLLNRVVSTNIMDRLQGVVSGMAFNKSATGNDDIRIRGRSTILSNSEPLIVLDNFAYEGNLESINPNDIASVTVLKDAAAASIWGARASNGVIVLTSKKTTASQPLRINFNANTTVLPKPDLMQYPNMSTADLIGVEQLLFDKGAYSSALANTTTWPAVSPVAELLQLRKTNQITAEELALQLDELRSRDIRNDFTQYTSRIAQNSQYALSITTGGLKSRHYFSLGYDNNISTQRGISERATLRSNNDFSFSKKLELNTRIYLVYAGNKGPVYPTYSPSSQFAYERLKNPDGTAAAITRSYRDVFKEASYEAGFLNWQYRPAEDNSFIDERAKQLNIVAGSTIKYEITNGLNATLDLQEEAQLAANTKRYMSGSYYVRDLVNNFTQVSASKKPLSRPVPYGDIVDIGFTNMWHATARLQVAYNRSFTRHDLNAIVGTEARQQQAKGDYHRVYGYNDNALTTKNINSDSLYRLYPSGLGYILSGLSITETTDRYLSYYFNGSYAYDKKYTVSFSARRDASNYFGVDANARSVPLWSVGGKWHISNERFYNHNWGLQLALRATFGYNGNTNRSTTAYTVANSASSSILTNQPFALITSPGNPMLRWEKTGISNFALDFKTKNGRINGSVEYYIKKGKDLIGKAPLDPTIGFLESGAYARYTGNVAAMKGNGWDFEITTINLQKKIRWITNFLFSTNKDEVTKYDMPATTAREYMNAYYSITPVVGKPIYALFSYKWAGLNPQTGDPQGYLNNAVSKDYTALTNIKVEELEYNGSTRPNVWGSFRNSFGLGQLSLSFNILYKLGYYFRRPSINYTSLFSAKNMGHKDFGNRWQQSGDELYTNVPSMIYPEGNSNRSFFYINSSTLVEKADHIRLQDIRLDYNFNHTVLKVINGLVIYAYVNNLGVIWRTNSLNLDPDYYYGISPQPGYSFGLSFKL